MFFKEDLIRDIKQVNSLYHQSKICIHPYQHPYFINLNKDVYEDITENGWILRYDQNDNLVFFGYSFKNDKQKYIEFPHGPFSSTIEGMKEGLEYIKSIFKGYKIAIGPYQEYSEELHDVILKSKFKVSDRKWHNYTVVLDTAKMKNFENYSNKNKNLIKSAENNKFSVSKADKKEQFILFLEEHNKLAEKKGFGKINEQYINNIMHQKNEERIAEIYLLNDYEGNILAGSLIIKIKNFAFYQRGFSKKNKSVKTQYLHYEICKDLYKNNCIFYDLGGIDFTDPIYMGVTNFKIQLNNNEYIKTLPQYIIEN